MAAIWMAGVDGCQGGWLALMGKFVGEKFVQEKPVLLSRFEKIFRLPESPKIIAVDIPIGLLDEPLSGGRECDRLARRLLGWPRASSIFTPPTRPALKAKDYHEAKLLSGGLSKQAFYILPKIHEADEALGKIPEGVIFETHPELVFMRLAGKPLKTSKRMPLGQQERENLLTETGLFSSLRDNLSSFPRRLRLDDLLDAYACLLTALRIHQGEAQCLPTQPPRDSRGRPMAIWF